MSPRLRGLLRALVTVLACAALVPLVQHGIAGLEATPLGERIVLLEPRALYGLTLLPLIVGASWWSLSDLPPLRRWFSTALRAFLIGLLTLALARPASLRASELTSTVFAVDVSDSIDASTLAVFRERVRAAYEARGPHHVALVTFAKTAKPVELTDGVPETFERHAEGAGTDLEAALALAHGLFAPGHVRQVVLLSDGRETRGDVLRAARALADRGVRLYFEAPTGPPPSEVAIEELAVPERVNVGEPFTVRVRVTSTVARDARVRLLRDGLLNGLDGARDVALPAGTSELEFRSIARVSGPITYRAEIDPQGADRFAENNAFERTVHAQGKPRVLYVEATRAEAQPFSSLLEAAGFDVEVRTSLGLPNQARELLAFDFVILSDVPREEVSPAAMQAIRTYLEEGGAFMMAGGERSFGLGGYRGSALESLLPVRLDTERRRDQPSVALMLVIDKSGSMNGEKMELAKEAARATSELLGAEDYLGVIGFDAEPTRVVRLSSAQNRLAISRGIGRLTAGGGTLIFPALDAAYADLASVRARIKHVILLTDGQTQESGIPLLVQNMHVDGITVSTIGLGDDVNRRLIEEVARLGHGRAYFTSDPSNVPRLFVRETQAVARSAAVEDYVRVHVRTQADFLRALPMGEAPFLRGYVATRARPSPAQVLLTSDHDEPLLARMHVGLGWSLAWTSDLKSRWSASWYRWPAHSAFWAQLIREHMRKQRAPDLEVQSRLEGDELVATIEALDEGERFLNGLSGALRIRAAGAEERVLPLAQVGPGRYEARAPLVHPGTVHLHATLAHAGQHVRTAQGELAYPFPREYAPGAPDVAKLETACALTGGGRAPAAAALFRGERREFARREHVRPLLWLSLLAFVCDLGARRLRPAFRLRAAKQN